MSRTLSELKRGPGRSKGCPRCDATENVAAVGIHVQQLGSNGQPGGGHRVVSRSKSLCEPCAVEVYELLERAFLDAIRGSES